MGTGVRPVLFSGQRHVGCLLRVATDMLISKQLTHTHMNLSLIRYKHVTARMRSG